MRLVGDNLASGFPNWFKLPPQTANTVPALLSTEGAGPRHKATKPLTTYLSKQRQKERDQGQRR